MKVDLPEGWDFDSLTFEPVFNLQDGATLTKANKDFRDKKRAEYLMLRVYNGKNIKGYIRPFYESRGAGYMNTTNSNIYAIKYLDQDYYIPYCMNMIATKGSMKYFFKRYLPDFPELLDMIKSGEIKVKEFQRNHTVLMYYIDKILEDRKGK